MNEKLRFFCVLNDSDLRRPFSVGVNATNVTIDELKIAVQAACTPELDYWAAANLTLSGFSRREKAERKLGYGQDLEDGHDQASEFSDLPGNCLVKGGSFYKVMNSAEDVSSFFSPLLEKRVCHVLVLVPQERALSQLQAYLGIVPSGSRRDLKRQKVEPATQPTTVNPHPYSNTQQLFELDANYLAESGSPATALVLYCRKAFHDQFKFLHQRVLLNSCLGWILGPPGTGKSTTCLAFISVMANDFPDWTVTWIHLRHGDAPKCARFSERQKWSFVITDIDMPYMSTFLDDVEGNHIVFLDGFDDTQGAHMPFLRCCNIWRGAALGNRRLVAVCSKSFRGKSNLDYDTVNRVEQFIVHTWELDECSAAEKHIDELGYFGSQCTNVFLQSGFNSNLGGEHCEEENLSGLIQMENLRRKFSRSSLASAPY
ncbi:hypothetical protein HDU80_001110 [Chytriomyces hyalinus]|nr:hypothetical protein HDU80_001110 [Chytriomyces hyalinus]